MIDALRTRSLGCRSCCSRPFVAKHPRRMPSCSVARLPVHAQAQPEFKVPEVGWMWDTKGGKAAATQQSLRSANIKAKKSLGQNFCTDDAVLANIVRAAGVTADDLVVEVGPGTGNLTRHLIATRAQVVAVEKDDTLIEKLREEFQQAPNLQLIHGDVLRLKMDDLIANMMQQQQERKQANAEASTSSSSRKQVGRPAKVKVVANLPYNITKDFLRALLPRGEEVSQLSIMIQEEVAQRLLHSSPGNKDYRSMSVFTHFYSRPLYHFLIPKEKYFPVPGVDGALVTFQLRPAARRPKVSSEKRFIQMVEKAFSERRKKMRNSLAPLYTSSQCEAALAACGLRVDSRAQDLSLEQFVEVFRQLQQQESSGEQQQQQQQQQEE